MSVSSSDTGSIKNGDAISIDQSISSAKYRGYAPRNNEVEMVMSRDDNLRMDAKARSTAASKKRANIIKTIGSDRSTAMIASSLEKHKGGERPMRNGLYAIIMPSGTGKTTLANIHGLLDIDDLHPEGDISFRLMEMRHDAIDSGDEPHLWALHNDFWFAVLNSALEGYNFEETPTVILVHSLQCALAIGAFPMATVTPDETLHRKNISNRGAYQRGLAITNWTFTNSPVEGHEIVVCNSHDEIGLHVAIRARTVSCILRPMLWDSLLGDTIVDCPPMGYDNADDVFLIGAFDKVDVEYAVEMYKRKRIPKVCLGACMQNLGKVKFNSEDTNWCRVESLRLNCLAKAETEPEQVGEPKVTWGMILDPDTDWFELYPMHSALNMQRANVTIRRLFETLNVRNDATLLEIMNAHVNSSHGFVTTLIIYYLGVVADFRTELFDSIIGSGILLIREEKWVEIHKEIHAIIRVTHEFNGTQLTDSEYVLMQYMQNVIGRKTYKVDSGPEIEKRRVLRIDAKRALSDGVWSQANYVRLFEKHLRLCTQKVTDGLHSLPYTHFRQFLRQKYEVVTKGGLTRVPPGFREPSGVVAYLRKMRPDGVRNLGHVIDDLAIAHEYLYAEDKIEISTEPNKKSILEDESKINALLAHIFKNEGYNDSGVSPKFNEAAKERVLIPGSFQHFIVVSYMLHVIEKGGQVGNVLINIDKSVAEAIKHHDRRLKDEGWKFMWDFPDHNAYHSVYEMQAVMAAHGNFAQHGDGMAQRMVHWVMKSFENMKIDDQVVNSGLFSGWRCTSWINTVLNHVYLACAVECFQTRHGYNPILAYDGTGDDVDINLKSAEDGYRLYKIMMEMGYEDNEIKQLVTQSCHEFMRMIYTKNKIYSCVNRALSGFVCGDLERSGATPEDALKSGYINISMLKRRGLSDHMCQALELCVIKRYGRYKESDGVYKPMSRCVIHGHIDDGGLGIPDELHRIWRLKTKVPKPDSKSIRMKAEKYSMTRDAIHDGLTELETLGMECEHDEERVKEMAMDSISMESVQRALVNYTNSDEFIDYWNFECEVTSFDCMSKLVDNSLLLEWLMEMSSDEIDKSHHECVRYDRLCTLLPFTNVNKIKFAAMLSAENGFDYISATNMRIDQRYANLAPEWANSAITRFCRHRVLRKSWTMEEAELKSKYILSTYAHVYQFCD